MNTVIRIAASTIIMIGAISCGGGGGGGTSFYGGVWDFAGTKVLDDCNSGMDTNTILTLTVNQDEDYVVVDSGSLTMTGTTNDHDGFDVSGSSTMSNGCVGGYAYGFRDASDGSADVALAIVANCGGSTCSLGYAGTAIRRGGKLLVSGPSNLGLDAMLETIADQCLEQSPQKSASGNTDLVEGDVESDALMVARSLLTNM